LLIDGMIDIFPGLIAHAEKLVSDDDFEKRAERFPVDTPTTKVRMMMMMM